MCMLTLKTLSANFCVVVEIVKCKLIYILQMVYFGLDKKYYVGKLNLHLWVMKIHCHLVLATCFLCCCSNKSIDVCDHEEFSHITLEEVTKFLSSGEWTYQYTCLNARDTLRRVDFSNDIPYKMKLIKLDHNVKIMNMDLRRFFQTKFANPLYGYISVTSFERNGKEFETRPLIFDGNRVIHYSPNALIKVHEYFIDYIDNNFLIISDNQINYKKGREYLKCKLVYFKKQM